MFSCKHQWVEKAKTYAPPVIDKLMHCGFNATSISNSELNKLMFGVTAIEYQCKCGEHYTAVLPGK
jgi:aspartate carbamoyltransferase regulatory subunit